MFMLIGVALAADIPQQIHIALAGNNGKGIHDGMAISWVTTAKTATSTVQYGEVSGKLLSNASGSSSSYFRTFDHIVILENLLPETKYFYRVGDSAAGWSEEYFFTTAPATPRGFSASIYGDMGYGASGNAVETRKQLDSIKERVDFFWHLGDIAYADDDALRNDSLKWKYEDIWDAYMSWMENITAFKPYQVLVGNHEAECHSPGCLTTGEKLKNFTAYNHRFRMPHTESQSRTNMWHSFNYGLAHFISIDTETDFPGAPEEGKGPVYDSGHFGTPGEQLKWLEQDLQQAIEDRKAGVRPWIIAGGHRPIYDASEVTSEQKKTFEELLHKYGVDLYFTGHVHSYARSWPVYGEKVEKKDYSNPSSPVYIVVGSAGCDEMKAQLHAPMVAEWNAFQDTKYYSSGVLHVLNATHLVWELVRSADGAIIDQFTLVKNRA